MKQILIPTDFSDYALNAIFTALKLEQNRSCHFILLHAYEPDNRNISNRQNTVRTGMVYDAMRKDVTNKLEETLQMIAKVCDNSPHKFSTLAKRGDLASTVSELVPKYDLDLIVMGTKGATGNRQVFLGSNTVKVLKKIWSCPILIVPRKFNFQALRKIVFPTEYVNFYSKGQLNPLVSLAEAWRSQVLIFHVAQEFKLSEKQLSNKKIIKQRLGSIRHSFYKVPIHTTVANAITKFTEEKLADMICMVHYQHTFLERLIEEPVVKKIGFHTEVPLFLLPE
ncbi:universal stress protein [Maribacter sp. 2210JD10-5]|uniref:universal stress protein n=1 Tax=Maribacter sp. 2210JD10-5 TaxID=3386272 RepID=UPI0039BC3E07